MYSAGGAIYGNSGLEPDSDASIKGMQYIEDLFEKKLLVDPGTYDDGKGTPEWTRAADDFGKGATVFTDCPAVLVPQRTAARSSAWFRGLGRIL